MKIEDIRNMTRFPNKVNMLEYKDRAKIILEKKVFKEDQITGRKTFEYFATIEFTYPKNDPIKRETFLRDKSLKKLLKRSLISFDQRNNQMISREPSLI